MRANNRSLTRGDGFGLSAIIWIVVLFGVAGLGCDEDNGDDDNDDDNDDDVPSCYGLGEWFAPPEGVTDPARLDVGQYCCNNEGQNLAEIVIPEEPIQGECVRPDPLMFMCIHESVDNTCGPAENFCTSPLDCFPPSDDFPFCCGEGDRCFTDPQFSVTTGVSSCCEGLQAVLWQRWDLEEKQCAQDYTPGWVICVRDCGDGDCTLGETPCTCGSDCPIEDWQ